MMRKNQLLYVITNMQEITKFSENFYNGVIREDIKNIIPLENIN